MLLVYNPGISVAHLVGMLICRCRLMYVPASRLELSTSESIEFGGRSQRSSQVQGGMTSPNSVYKILTKDVSLVTLGRYLSVGQG